ncbi:MAG: cell wall-binding repeat-containing protein [Euzebyales bacterium]|nr:cell wall-binding repeat-containing protein [Euzebyales bacterium]
MPLAQRRLSLPALIAALTILVAVLPAAPAAADGDPAGAERRLTDLINAERGRLGLPGLRVDVRLVASARDWSQRMAERGAIAHDPDLSSRVPAGAAAWAENVGMASASSDVADRVHALFMGSAGHRANLLDGRFTEVGIGVVVSGGRAWVAQRFTAGAHAPVAAAVEPTARLAERLFPGGSARHAVVVRDDVFADALASGSLVSDAGPILLNPPDGALHPQVRGALEATLPRGGTVWLAGGAEAVSDHAAAELRAAGWSVRRVSGGGRVETAAEVARVVAGRTGRPATALVVTAGDWPDAAAGGAYGAAAQAPILLAGTDEVPQATRRALTDTRPSRTAALGGRAALSDRVVSDLGAERVAGPTRQGTSADVAEQVWGYRDASPSHWIAVPAFGADAWTWAVTAAPLAARYDAAVLLVGDELSGATREYLAGLGYGGGRTATLLTHGPVTDTVASQIRDLLGE